MEEKSEPVIVVEAEAVMNDLVNLTLLKSQLVIVNVDVDLMISVLNVTSFLSVVIVMERSFRLPSVTSNKGL